MLWFATRSLRTSEQHVVHHKRCSGLRRLVHYIDVTYIDWLLHGYCSSPLTTVSVWKQLVIRSQVYLPNVGLKFGDGYPWKPRPLAIKYSKILFILSNWERNTNYNATVTDEPISLSLPVFLIHWFLGSFTKLLHVPIARLAVLRCEDKYPHSCHS